MRSAKSETQGKEKRSPKEKVQLPSQRYPNAPIIETDLAFEQLPSCAGCGGLIQDSGMKKDSEFLTVIPRQFFVVRQKRHKYRCSSCHGDIKTPPGEPKIKYGSS